MVTMFCLTLSLLLGYTEGEEKCSSVTASPSPNWRVSVCSLCALTLFPLQWTSLSPEDSQVLSVLYWWSPFCCQLWWEERVS